MKGDKAMPIVEMPDRQPTPVETILAIAKELDKGTRENCDPQFLLKLAHQIWRETLHYPVRSSING